MGLSGQKSELIVGTVEIVVGVAYALSTIGLLAAATYYADLWPHKSEALSVMLCYTATAASCLTVGGYFLRSRSEMRYLLQTVFLPFAAIGAIAPLAVVGELYLGFAH